MTTARDHVIDALTHRTDGPVTGPVLVSRALDLAVEGVDLGVLREVLEDELRARGLDLDRAEETRSQEWPDG